MICEDVIVSLCNNLDHCIINIVDRLQHMNSVLVQTVGSLCAQILFVSAQVFQQNITTEHQ